MTIRVDCHFGMHSLGHKPVDTLSLMSLLLLAALEGAN